MKNLILLCFTLMAIWFNSFAQVRSVDLDVQMRKPKTGDTILLYDPFTIKLRVWNKGTDTLFADDTLRVYLTVDNNPITFYDAGTGKWNSYTNGTNFRIPPGDSDYVVFNNFVIGQGFEEGTTKLCMSVIPQNDLDTIKDNTPGNNESCSDILLLEQIPQSILAVKKISALTVYPNPAQDAAKLDFVLNESSDVGIRLTDLTGRLVYGDDKHNLAPGKHTTTIRTFVLPKGIYMYHVSASGSQLTGKLVVE